MSHVFFLLRPPSAAAASKCSSRMRTHTAGGIVNLNAHILVYFVLTHVTPADTAPVLCSMFIHLLGPPTPPPTPLPQKPPTGGRSAA